MKVFLSLIIALFIAQAALGQEYRHGRVVIGCDSKINCAEAVRNFKAASDSIYQEVNFRIDIVAIVETKLDTDPIGCYKLFSFYKQLHEVKDKTKADLVFAFFERAQLLPDESNFEDFNTIGCALLGRFGAGFLEVAFAQVDEQSWKTAAIVKHELAHTLSAPHDEENIMRPIAPEKRSHNNLKYSQTTLKYIRNFLEQFRVR